MKIQIKILRKVNNNKKNKKTFKYLQIQIKFFKKTNFCKFIFNIYLKLLSLIRINSACIYLYIKNILKNLILSYNLFDIGNKKI